MKYYKSSGNSDYIYRVYDNGRADCHAITSKSRRQNGNSWRFHMKDWPWHTEKDRRSSTTIISELTEAEAYIEIL